MRFDFLPLVQPTILDYDRFCVIYMLILASAGRNFAPLAHSILFVCFLSREQISCNFDRRFLYFHFTTHVVEKLSVLF